MLAGDSLRGVADGLCDLLIEAKQAFDLMDEVPMGEIDAANFIK